MHQSRPISHAGHLLGVAATGDHGWFFVAIDARLDDLHGQHFRSAAEAERVARLVFARHTAPSWTTPPRFTDVRPALHTVD